MITSHSRGHLIFTLNGIDWFFSDTKKPYRDNRPCKKCGKFPTKEGYDACLGYIEGAASACCGHGVTDKDVRKKG